MVSRVLLWEWFGVIKSGQNHGVEAFLASPLSLGHKDSGGGVLVLGRRL